MLYALHQWTELYSPLRMFQYITFRALGAASTAFLIGLILGPPMIRGLRRFKLRQPDRLEAAPAAQKLHLGKIGTPTMGGLLILLATVFSTLLWAIPGNLFVLLSLAAFVYMGLIGFWDDYLKVSRRNRKGLSAQLRLALQIVFSCIFTAFLYSSDSTRMLADQVMLPFLKNPLWTGIGMAGAMVFLSLVLVGATNAVNLTDGLDGLAIGCTNAVALAYLILSYIAGHARFSSYLLVPYIPGSGELAVFCGALLGAGLGFLWYNCHPARVFMGDTGSLALGGGLAAVAILIQHELTLILVGGVFVIEAGSVLLQVAGFKISGGRRIFRCAPLHHHFEIIGKERAIREGRDQDVIETMVT
ncbi:MAG: phospho-N-acetylmuramoyl-pentapeptide-transferase, partial [Kiritimatiellia bacterium]|nr:phospho-N-acetylmuramoyl-pentapeptide-transferase [Kiritimatiellia bacterium]